MFGGMNAAMQAWGAPGSYMIDAVQRTILFWDVLRQRSDQYYAQKEKAVPHVLSFDAELVLDGRTFARPVNYGLVRVKPPQGVVIDAKKRPFVVVDPRAGHGPGIGGFKADSELGVAMRAGHPCYFVGFSPDPMPGQTIEDIMRADDIEALAELGRSTTTPILASEYLTTRYEYKPVLEARAADIIMIDPTWAGGITESKKIATMAEAYKRPVAMHDCTGPFTLNAGVHLAINATNALYQESLRSYLRVTYPEMVTDIVTVEQGHLLAPTAPGLGTTLLPDVRKRPDVTIVVSE
jgi:hypothetical protein